MAATCARGQPADPALLQATAGERLSRISLTEVHAFRALAARVNPPAQCEGLSPGLVAWTIAQLVDHTDPAHAWRQAVWLSRYEAAKLYGHGGHWAQAEAQAALAWQPTADAGVGFYLAQLQARVINFALDLRALNMGRVAIVAHAGVMRALTGHCLQAGREVMPPHDQDHRRLFA